MTVSNNTLSHRALQRFFHHYPACRLQSAVILGIYMDRRRSIDSWPPRLIRAHYSGEFSVVNRGNNQHKHVTGALMILTDRFLSTNVPAPSNESELDTVLPYPWVCEV